MAEVLEFAGATGSAPGRRGRRKMSDDEKAAARMIREAKKMNASIGTDTAAETPRVKRTYTKRKNAASSAQVAALGAENHSLSLALQRNKSKISNYMKQMFSPMGRASELAATFAGGYTYGMFSDFVLVNLAKNDRESWIFKYRALIVAAVAIYGDKVLPQKFARNQYVIASFQGMIGAAAADFAQQRQLIEPKAHGVYSSGNGRELNIKGQLNAGNHTYDYNASLAQISGIPEYQLAQDTGFLPVSIANSLAKSYIKSAMEGDAHAKKTLSGADLDACNSEQRESAMRLMNAVHGRLGNNTDNISSVLNRS